MTEQLIAIFAFGVLMTGVVFIGFVRAREVAERAVRVRAANSKRNLES